MHFDPKTNRIVSEPEFLDSHDDDENDASLDDGYDEPDEAVRAHAELLDAMERAGDVVVSGAHRDRPSTRTVPPVLSDAEWLKLGYRWSVAHVPKADDGKPWVCHLAMGNTHRFETATAMGEYIDSVAKEANDA